MPRESLNTLEDEFLNRNTNILIGEHNFHFSEEKNNQLKNLRKSSFLKRNLRTMNNGSLRNSIQSFIGICFGPILFNIPKVFQSMGIIFGIIFFILNYLIAIISYNFYIDSVFILKGKTIIDVIRTSLGKLSSKFALFSIILLIIVKASIFYIIGFDLFINILEKFSFYKIDKESSYFEQIKIRSIFFIISYLIVIYFIIQKNLSKFRYFSMFFLIVLIYIMVLVMCQSYYFFVEIPNKEILLFPKKFNKNFFSGISSILLGYYSHSVVINIWAETINPTIKRCNKIKRISLNILLMSYLIFGITGYISLLDKTPELMPTRFNKNSSTYDVFMSIGIILYILGNFVILSLYGPSLAKYIKMFFGLNEITEKKRKTFVLVGYFISTLISIFIIDVHNLFSFCGGVLSNLIGYIFPIIIILKIKKQEFGILKIICLLIILVYLIFIPISLIIFN